ncbi:MAG: cyclic nucleotide-binding domain-containing protein [Acidobacteriia bacterium]|nr:cyclic nucleotide-binding domain-containing protein [Terriglobia bacterium]
MLDSLRPVLAEHPFLSDLSPRHLDLVVGCASNVRFEAGKYLFREEEDANQFYIIREGKVAVEIRTPHRGPLTVQTVSAGEILGWSWLLPPYQWHFDARAVEPTRAIALDGKCLRVKCENDHDLGYELLKRFAQIMEQRLEATRLQVLDIYGNPS